MQKAYLANKKLEAGALANVTEGRMVGHYWLRCPQLAPKPEMRKQIKDAVALGELVDMRILVIEWGKTSREMVQRALKKIAPSSLLLAGIILNKTKRWGSSYYYDHYYTGYRKEKPVDKEK